MIEKVVIKVIVKWENRRFKYWSNKKWKNCRAKRGHINGVTMDKEVVKGAAWKTREKWCKNGWENKLQSSHKIVEKIIEKGWRRDQKINWFGVRYRHIS